MPGTAKAIAVGQNGNGGGSAWIITPEKVAGGRTLATWSNGAWVSVDGGVTEIAIDASGIPWAINDSGVIMRRSVVTTEGYRLARCRDMKTGEFLGWLGSGDGNYVEIVPDKPYAHGVMWDMQVTWDPRGFRFEELFLRKDTSGGDRFLGVYGKNRGSWSLAGTGLIRNGDGSISLRGQPSRMLCREGAWANWSDGNAADGLLAIDVPITS